MRTLLILAAFSVLSACATFGGGSTTERIVVQAAVMQMVETSSDPVDKAQKINEAAAQLRTLLLDNTATVDSLRSALTTRVANRQLTGAERLLAMEVINTISAEVEKRLGSGILSPDAIVRVNTVLDWVKDATAFYVPLSP